MPPKMPRMSLVVTLTGIEPATYGGGRSQCLPGPHALLLSYKVETPDSDRGGILHSVKFSRSVARGVRRIVGRLPWWAHSPVYPKMSDLPTFPQVIV